MTKDESMMMKGVAIILMIFGHLFYQDYHIAKTINYIYIGGVPLAQMLTRATSPVAFYLILGGYGLYKVYEAGDTHRYSRILKLIVRYWVTLLIFVLLGSFLHPDKYPGDWKDMLSNFTGYNTTYNASLWFLLPYIILSFSSPWLFKVMNGFKPMAVIGFTLALNIFTSFCISRYGEEYLYQNDWLYNPFLSLHLLFDFSVGAMAARTDFFNKAKTWIGPSIGRRCLLYCVLLILIIINFVFKYNFFYALGVTTCLLIVPVSGLIKRGLKELGRHSTNMWFIHQWIGFYFFQEFIYSFAYPMIIFLVCTLLSYAISIGFNYILNPIEDFIDKQTKIIKMKLDYSSKFIS